MIRWFAVEQIRGKASSLAAHLRRRKDDRLSLSLFLFPVHTAIAHQ
jgi:hypothetical protein